MISDAFCSPLSDHLAAFPISEDLLPRRLRSWLSHVGDAPNMMVEVAASFGQKNASSGVENGPLREHGAMFIATPPHADGFAPIVQEAGDGFVEFSVPDVSERGGLVRRPSVSGEGYIVASWGDGMRASFCLSDDVWMRLGLTMRCDGGDAQILRYDDLSAPVHDVAFGDVRQLHNFSWDRPVLWRMRNDYLRQYLWRRGASGVRVFWYEAWLPDHPQLRALLNGTEHQNFEASPWCEVSLQQAPTGDALILLVRACVRAIPPVLAADEESAAGLVWPDIDGPMDEDRASSMVTGGTVWLRDSVLQRYERHDGMDATPFRMRDGDWLVAPGYGGQWCFPAWRRVGRNLLRTDIYDLHKGVPDVEIRHVHGHAISAEEAEAVNHDAEHIVAKTDRLLHAIVALSEELAVLSRAVGHDLQPRHFCDIDTDALRAEGWRGQATLCRLAEVAPVDMSDSEFLNRAKQVVEFWGRFKPVPLRRLLTSLGCGDGEVNRLQPGKLLQALTVICSDAADDGAALVDLGKWKADDREKWGRSEEKLAALFIGLDFRQAEAHDLDRIVIKRLAEIGYDPAVTAGGYGHALDAFMNATIAALGQVAAAIRRLR